jgi:PPK2 family polyphosphate:nucleotide phosphotransferase
MKIISKKYRVSPRQRVRLSRLPTEVPAYCPTKKHYKKVLRRQTEDISALQERHYAQGRSALLLIFQGIDAAGKDGAIRHILSGVNPQGCEVYSFKRPSDEELKHDFLWRSVCRMPERGRIGIFNRSYYEDVLVVRVHPELLAGQALPAAGRGAGGIWAGRYKSIVDFEGHMERNGTRIIKFFLHISKREQRRRFLERLDDPSKNWKFSAADIQERKYWARYEGAFEACLGATSTAAAPWYIVPADDKENARLIIAQVILDEMKGLKMSRTREGPGRKRELKAMRRML